MSKFKYCPIIEVGDVFTRVDKNGKVWTAKVINRTEYFVDVEKIQPYQIKVGDEFGWHYEDGESNKTYERCEIHRHYIEEEDGYEERTDFFGKKYMTKKYKRVPTNKYWIECKEDYSKHSKYDRTYELIKHETKSESAEIGLKKFWNYCETGNFELNEEKGRK